MSVDTLDRAPTVADAQRVADEFALDPNVVKVLLYGSVAKGAQHKFSDIDLVVVHRDLDYSRRHQIDRELDAIGRRLAGHPVQVRATDLPEWTMRTRLRNSFEAALHTQPMRTLHERPVDDNDVDWEKEQPMPTDELTNAVSFIREGLSRRLVELTDHLNVSANAGEYYRNNEEARLAKMGATVAAAVMVIEVSLKGLAVLVAGQTLSEKEIRNAGHNIAECLEMLDEPHRAAIANGLRQLGLDPDNLGQWRTRAYAQLTRKKPDETQPPMDAEDDIDTSTVSALAISDLLLDETLHRVDPERATEAAVALSNAVLRTFETAAPLMEQVAAARNHWEMTKRSYETLDLHTFALREPPLDLSPLFEGSKQQKRDAFAAGLGERFDELVRTSGVGVQDQTLRDRARDYRRQGRKAKWIAKKLDKSPSWVSDHTSDVVPPTQRRRRKR